MATGHKSLSTPSVRIISYQIKYITVGVNLRNFQDKGIETRTYHFD